MWIITIYTSLGYNSLYNIRIFKTIWSTIVEMFETKQSMRYWHTMLHQRLTHLWRSSNESFIGALQRIDFSIDSNTACLNPG